MTAQQPLWLVFKKLTEHVKRDHATDGVIDGGHDFVHALMVAQYAQMIAEDERTGILGWIAGICHNTDRLADKLKPSNVPEITWVVTKLWTYLNTDIGNTITEEEQEIVVMAVLNHSKKNDKTDNPVTVVLKDADQLANIGFLHSIRAAQYWSKFRSNYPAVDYVHFLNAPNAPYNDPKSVLRDINYALEWETWLRLPKAKELAKPYFDDLRSSIENVKRQLTEVGLFPLPEELR